MGFDVALTVQNWGAWAPGLETREAWQSWASADDVLLPVVESVPKLARVPAMARRRIDRLGRVALEAAFGASGDLPRLPSIFVSRRGDAPRSFELLTALIAGEGLSPTAFGLSVHNAIAAQFSMARADNSTYSALAAGSSGVENALVEAAGWLSDGTPELLLVAFDTSVPEAFRAYRDEPDPLFAWAWRLGPVGSPGRCLRLAASLADSGDSTGGELAMPAALQPMRQFLRGARRWTARNQGLLWTWSVDE